MTDQIACPNRDHTQTTQCCHPTQTCCNGACCSSGETCTDIVNRGFFVSQGAVNTYWMGGLQFQWTVGSSGYTGAFGGGAWNKWAMQDGSTSTPWQTCSAQYLGAVSTTRVIILPICLIVALAVATILVFQAAGLEAKLLAIPALCLVVCCIFLFFSIFWTVAIVISLGALFGWGSAAKGGSAYLAALVVEFFALAVVTGGLGLGQFLFASSQPYLFFDVAGAHSSSTWGVLAACSNYYDYFLVDPTNVPYNIDPTTAYTNYCSNGWYTYLGLIADLVVTFQIIMLVATGVAYLRGGAGKSV